MPKISVVMPVYNGEAYLREQIDSILHQTYGDWVLFIRDDGSKDATQEIIGQYTAAYPDKIIRITEPSLSGGSARANFA